MLGHLGRSGNVKAGVALESKSTYGHGDLRWFCFANSSLWQGLTMQVGSRELALMKPGPFLLPSVSGCGVRRPETGLTKLELG